MQLLKKLIYYYYFCFNCLLTDQITKIILVDTLVHPSNKSVDLVFPVASKKYGTLHEFSCHPCSGAMLIFSVLFQF